MNKIKTHITLTILTLFFVCINANSQTNEKLESNFMDYQKTTASELGDLSKKMWSVVIKSEKGIPQGVYKTESNYFIYVQRIKDRVKTFQKYKFDRNGEFINFQIVELKEVQSLMNKFKK